MKQLTVAIALAIALVTFAARGVQGQSNCPVGVLPSAIVAGEFNKDAIPDLAVANHSSDNITLLLSGGKADCKVGSVSFEIRTISVEAGPSALAVGDFDGNGCQDLAVANETAASITILLGKCNGTFTVAPKSPIQLADMERPIFIIVGDFDRDGHQDLVAVDQITGSIFTLYGDNSGVFPYVEKFDSGKHPNSVSVGDCDGDAIQDLFVSNESDDSISIFKGSGVRNFGFSIVGTQKVGLGPSYVIQSFGYGWLDSIFPQLLYPVVPDFNSDGLQDLVVANMGSHDISILLGNGDCTFQKQVRLKTHGNDPSAVILGDFNRDGKQDIAVTNSGTNNVSVFLGDRLGGFTLVGPQGKKGEKYPVGPNPSSIAKGDFNRDGCWDLAIANKQADLPQQESTVTILFGEKNKNRNPQKKEPLCTGTFDPPNSPPTVSTGISQGLEVHASRPVVLRGSGTDLDNDPLSFAWIIISEPEGSQATIKDTRKAVATFTPDLPGTYVLQLTATDGRGGSSSDMTKILATNNAPVASVSGDEAVVVGDVVQLKGKATDPDGDGIIVRWELASRPTKSQATLSQTDTMSPKFVPDVPGDYVVKLIVTDNLGGVARADVKVTVLDQPSQTYK